MNLVFSIIPAQVYYRLKSSAGNHVIMPTSRNSSIRKLKRDHLKHFYGVFFLISGWLGPLILWSGGAATEPGQAGVSFRNEVMAVLSKAGCNAGACHGNANGKGGLKLSLRGQDPDRDYETLVRDWLGRRIDRVHPAKSLMLLKPTTGVPHEGGKRFAQEDIEYALLEHWISSGAVNDLKDAPVLEALFVTPGSRVLIDPDGDFQIRVQARFSDGNIKDVTRLTVFEVSHPIAVVSGDGWVQREGFGELTIIARYLDLQKPVRVAFVPERPGFVWSNPRDFNEIDGFIHAKLQALRMNPSEVCDDATFIRRAWLDITGRIPPLDETLDFLRSESPNKRGRMVEALLMSESFADFWALKWSDLLRNEEKVLDRKGVQAFHRWIREQLKSNRPVNAFMADLLSARGSTYHRPQSNFYRGIRDPRELGEAVARVALGTRLQCAQCHNHPFDRWTQDDYYNWTAVFTPVRYKILENRRRDENDKHEFVGEQVVWINPEATIKNPASGREAVPTFLGAQAAQGEHGRERGSEDSLMKLAEWVGAPENRQFARAQVNRIWFHLMGRGLVDPVDDFRATNPASHPDLIEWLTDEFIRSGFDLKQMIRLIASSRAYQVSSHPNETNLNDEINFAFNRVRRIQAEVLLDAMMDVTGATLPFNGYPEGMRAVEIPGVEAVRARYQRPSTGDQFLKAFGKPPRLICSEEERGTETSMGQAFQLISGPAMEALISDRENRLASWLDSDLGNSELIRRLYLTSICREPGITELEELTRHVEASPTRRQGFEDLLWALMNSKEFLFRP